MIVGSVLDWQNLMSQIRDWDVDSFWWRWRLVKNERWDTCWEPQAGAIEDNECEQYKSW